MILTIPEHPDGGLVADPWDGVTVRVRFHPPVRMPAWLRAARASGWPDRKRLIEAERKARAAVQGELFAGMSPADDDGGR